VNTLIRRADGGWTGENTDVAGVLTALATAPELRGAGGLGVDLRGRRVAVIGAGGAARAACVTARGAGAAVTVYNRTAARGADLARALDCQIGTWDDRPGDAEIIINCTSVGMWPAVDATPVPAAALRPGTVVFDTVYNPPQTRLLREAAARGYRVIGGSWMFIGQAEAQYRYWHGVTPSLGVMAATLGHLLPGDGR
jgi:3-dehydroquinate dehydratase/shikimate dehydrogenase